MVTFLLRSKCNLYSFVPKCHMHGFHSHLVHHFTILSYKLTNAVRDLGISQRSVPKAQIRFLPVDFTWSRLNDVVDETSLWYQYRISSVIDQHWRHIGISKVRATAWFVWTLDRQLHVSRFMSNDIRIWGKPLSSHPIYGIVMEYVALSVHVGLSVFCTAYYYGQIVASDIAWLNRGRLLAIINSSIIIMQRHGHRLLPLSPHQYEIIWSKL